jgi:hypothetical protein
MKSCELCGTQFKSNSPLCHGCRLAARKARNKVYAEQSRVRRKNAVKPVRPPMSTSRVERGGLIIMRFGDSQ